MDKKSTPGTELFQCPVMAPHGDGLGAGIFYMESFNSIMRTA
jgi:hypothetical protein